MQFNNQILDVEAEQLYFPNGNMVYINKTQHGQIIKLPNRNKQPIKLMNEAINSLNSIDKLINSIFDAPKRPKAIYKQNRRVSYTYEGITIYKKIKN